MDKSISHEICGMLFRMLEGIEPKEDFPLLPLFEELLKEEHLLISKHSMKYLKEEHYFPGPIINRANRSRWQDEGASTFEDRAHQVVNILSTTYEPSSLSDEIKNELIKLMENEASKYSQDSLPQREE